jgi:hypothetical protein
VLNLKTEALASWSPTSMPPARRTEVIKIGLTASVPPIPLPLKGTAMSLIGPQPRWRSPELAAVCWGSSPATTVAPEPHMATYAQDRLLPLGDRKSELARVDRADRSLAPLGRKRLLRSITPPQQGLALGNSRLVYSSRFGVAAGARRTRRFNVVSGSTSHSFGGRMTVRALSNDAPLRHGGRCERRLEAERGNSRDRSVPS